MNSQDIKTLEKLLDIRHEENKDKFKVLFKKIDMLNTCIKGLPCKAHGTDLKWLIWGFRLIYGGISIALIRIIMLEVIKWH